MKYTKKNPPKIGDWIRLYKDDPHPKQVCRVTRIGNMWEIEFRNGFVNLLSLEHQVYLKDLYRATDSESEEYDKKLALLKELKKEIGL